MDGVLLVNKSKGWTSHDVVAKVRNLLKQQTINKPKVGHAGTLDPLAKGLLVILIGSYCKRAQEFSRLDKTYEVAVKLGFNSQTGDGEGKKTKISNKNPTLTQVQTVLSSFIGKIDQIPPAYSAIKIDGQRAYKLARAGKEVKLEPRPVQIYSITNLKYNYPKLEFKVKVSSGTYIRSLVEDIGAKLGTGAYMKELTRIEIGSFELQNATTELTFDSIKFNTGCFNRDNVLVFRQRC